MTQDEVIEMARQAGFEIDCCSLDWHKRITAFANLVAQRQRDKLTVMFLEAHEGAKDSHNYWHVAANKIKEQA